MPARRLATHQLSNFTSSRSHSSSLLNTRRCRRAILQACLTTNQVAGGSKRGFHSTARVQASNKDPYSVLGVKKDATGADIKKTYFGLARKYHPDTNPDKGAREKFQEIQDAYDVLKDEKKRAAYDQYGSASQQPGFDPNAFGGGGFGGGNPFGGFGGFGGFSSGRAGGGGGAGTIFDELFGAFGAGPGGPSRGRTQMARGTDVEVILDVSFLDACKGTNKKVHYSPVVDCAPCNSSGLKPGAERKRCGSCGGTGARTFVMDGGFHMQTTCTACGGEGSSVPKSGQCDSCGGVGKVRTRKHADIKVPPGVEDSMIIRMPSLGDVPISGKGQNGDLLIRVRVAPSKQFKRQGSHLFHEARIPMHTALLGGRVRVPTLDGQVDVRVPTGTQPGEEMVLKGRGVPRVYGGETGDLFVKFNITMPRTLTGRQRELLQAFADDLEGKKPAETPSETATKGEPEGDKAQAEAEGTEKEVNQEEEGEKKKKQAAA